MARSIRAPAFSVLVLALAVLAGGGTAPVRAQDNERSPGLFDRIFSGSERFGSGAQSAAGAEQTGSVQSSGPDLMLRVDRLEAQIRQLTGMLEQLQYRNQQLENQLRLLQEGGASVSATAQPRLAPAPPSTPAAAPAPAMRRGDAFDPSLHPGAPGQPHVLGAIPSGSGPHNVVSEPAEGAVGAPAGRPTHSPLDLATFPPPVAAQPRNAPASGTLAATEPPSRTPRDEFDLAYGYMLRKDYALAEESFRSFLAKYPSDRMVGDATFWLGESFFQRQRFRDAAEAFLNVSTKYDSSARAPEGLLRLGQSLAALGEKEAACASLGEVLRKFPRASAPVRQGVEREQKRVHC